MTVIDWLLDSDPSIRWQVMRDLTHEPAGVIAPERARVATEGWGARLLALQAPDGLWAGNAFSIEVVQANRDADGRWPLQNVHEGESYFEMEEGEGKPSRWNTLRALRVLERFARPDKSMDDG